jgi:hypothetical protein
MDGIIQTMVVIIQPDTMPLANIWLALFSMLLRREVRGLAPIKFLNLWCVI